VAGGLALTAALAAAWLVHRHVIAPTPDRRWPEGINEHTAETWREAARPTSAPASLLAGVRGEQADAGDPAGVPAPPQAERLAADVQTLGREVFERAAYACSAPAETVLAHYERALAERGFRRISQTSDEQGTTTAVFIARQRRAVVRLQPGPDRHTMDRVTVMISRPARAARHVGARSR